MSLSHSPPLQHQTLPSESRISPGVEAAITTATAQQLESVRDHIHDGTLDSFDAVRAAVRRWCVNERLLIGVSLDDQVELLRLHAGDFDLTLGHCDFETLHSHITGLAALVVAYLAEGLALQALEVVLDLLAELDLGLDAVVDCTCADHNAPALEAVHDLVESLGLEPDDVHLRPVQQRDEGDWHVSEYQNLAAPGARLDLVAYTAADVTFYVRHYIPGALQAKPSDT